MQAGVLNCGQEEFADSVDQALRTLIALQVDDRLSTKDSQQRTP